METDEASFVSSRVKKSQSLKYVQEEQKVHIKLDVWPESYVQEEQTIAKQTRFFLRQQEGPG